MNFSLNSVFSKYTANSDFPTPLKFCLFSTTSAIHLFKNSTWLCRRTGKKQVPSCSCLRSPNRIRITRCRTLFWAKNRVHKPFLALPSTLEIREKKPLHNGEISRRRSPMRRSYESFCKRLKGPLCRYFELYLFSKIQLVVYYQCCVLIGWATSRLFVIAH